MEKIVKICIAIVTTVALILAITFVDFDLDGLANITEFQIGTNFINSDTDSDGLNDGLEVGTYKTNPLVPDTDNDNLSDGLEANTYGTNPLVIDTDNDDLSDWVEIDIHGTDPLLADTDDDGLTDGSEVNTYGANPLSADTDNDNLSDGSEVNTHQTNPSVMDTDNDGLSDYAEVNIHGTNPLDNDMDDDWLTDGLEINGWQITINGLTSTATSDHLSQDSDGDNLSDWCEYDTYGSNPESTDTDGDGSGDRLEIVYATDLANQSSAPQLLPSGPEYPYLFLEVDYMSGYTPSSAALDYFESYFEWSLGVDVEIITDEVSSSELEAIGVSLDTISTQELNLIEQHFHDNPTTHLYVFYAGALEEGEAGGLSSNSFGVALNGSYVFVTIARERTVLLHEVGHALGMQHSDEGVMQSGPIFLNPVYDSKSWSQRNLLDKFSVDEPWT